MVMPNGKRNDLSIALVDPETGSCRDGLHPDRANENRGGESVVSYLLGLADTPMQTQHEQTASTNKTLLASVNHGNPAVAATSKPAEFSGKGVVPAKLASPATP